MTFITLDANLERVNADRTEYASYMGKDMHERANARKEIASGDGDFTRVSLSEGRFIDLSIHKDSFLDDAALRSDVTADTPIAWKSRYEPTVGVMTGSVYGNGPRVLYQTQDYSQFLTPFVVDAQEVMVPTMALTQDPVKLGQRQAGLMRQAEALKLKQETFLVNVMTGQALGTSLAQSIYNYIELTVSPYTDKTVYVVDPGVQSGTFETSNIVDESAEGGLTPAVFDALITQEMLSSRQVRTIHIPKKGLPWKKLIRYATIVANANAFGAGAASNDNLSGIPAEEWLKYWKTDMSTALEGGLIVEIFGRRFKIKANNALPKGCAICTTDEPAAEIFTITDRSISYDIRNPAEPYFEAHGEKRQIAIAVPDPWQRNWFALIYDTPSLT